MNSLNVAAENAAAAQSAISDTYVATFPVDSNKKLVSLKTSTDLPKTKLRAPTQVRPGTIVSN